MHDFKGKLREAKKRQKESDIELVKDPQFTSKSWHIGDLVTNAMDPPSSEWDTDGKIEKLERRLHHTQKLVGRLIQALCERKVLNTEELEEITYYL